MEKFRSKIVTEISWKRYQYLERENSRKTFDRWYQSFKQASFGIENVELSESAEGEEKFWEFYLNRSFSINSALLAFHLLFSILFIFSVYGYPLSLLGWPADPLFDKYQMIANQFSSWLFFNAMCSCFLFLSRYSQNVLKELKLDKFSCWMGIGNTLLCTRLFLLAFRLERSRIGRQCAAASVLNNPSDETFTYMALQMAVDVTSLGVFSVFPFPCQVTVLLCVVEWVSQMERLYSCGSRIYGDCAQLSFLPGFIGITLTFSYVIFLTFNPVLEHSARRSFENTERQKRALEEKRQIIHFLCCDTNQLLDHFQHATSLLVEELGGDGQGESEREGVEAQVQVVASAVSEMMAMVRLDQQKTHQDGRLQHPAAGSAFSLSQFVGKARRDLCLGSEEEDCISWRVDRAQVRLDSGCLLVVSRRLISLALFNAHVLQERRDFARLQLEFEVKTAAEGSRMAVRGGTECTTDSEHFVLCSLTWSNTRNFVMNTVKREHDSCALICLRMAASCGGCFWMSPSAVFCLIPCHSVQDLRSGSNVSMEAMETHRRVSLAGVKWSGVRMMAVMSVFGGEGLKGVIQRLSMACSRDIRTVSGPSMLVWDEVQYEQVLFVDALVRGRELRELGFKGLIVLISGFHSLIGNVEDPAFDFSVPIPCLEEDLLGLQGWLANHNSSPSSVDANEAGQSRRFSEVVGRVRWDIGERLKRYLVAKNGRWWEPLLVFGMLQLPLERRESYLRWRAFTPVKYLLHHTKHLDFFLICLIARNLLNTTLGNAFRLSVSNFLFAMIPYFLFLLRHYIFDYFLEPSGFPLMPIARIGVFLYVIIARSLRLLSLLASSARLIDLFTGNVHFSLPLKEDMSLDQLLEEKFGGFDTILAITLLLPNIGLGWNMLFPLLWPSIPIMTLIAFCMVVVFVWSFPRNLISHQLLLCFLVMQISSMLIELLITFNFEYIYRQEFSALCDHVESEDLIQRSISHCEPVIRRSLANMLSSQQALIRLLETRLFPLDSLLVDPTSLIVALRPMHYSTLLASQLINELRLSRMLAEGVVGGQGKKDIYFFRHVVEQVLTSFGCTKRGDTELVVRATVDSRLSVVRFDREEFVTLLVSCLVIAHKRLMRALVRRSGHERQVPSEIFIDIRPLEVEDRVYRFVDVRKMIVIVVDGGEKDLLRESKEAVKEAGEVIKTEESLLGALVAETEEATASFSENVCERYADKQGEPAFFETGMMEHECYSNFTRFTCPYQLTGDSHLASQAAKQGEGLLLLPSQPSDLDLLTDLAKFEALAGELRLDRRRKTLQPLPHNQWIELKKIGECGHMLLVTSLQEGRYWDQLIDRLRESGWLCEFVYQPLKYDFVGIQDYDCILLDRCADFGMIEVNFRDFIVKVRACGFQKLIVDLCPTPAELNDPPSENRESDSSEVMGLMSDKVDRAFCLPWRTLDSVDLHEACEMKLISLLLKT